MMPRYINANLAKAQFTGNFQEEYSVPHIHALIDDVPTADVQEVTRCEDCVFATYILDNQTNEITIFRCERTSERLKDEKSFCSWAIKKKAQPIRKENEK